MVRVSCQYASIYPNGLVVAPRVKQYPPVTGGRNPKRVKLTGAPGPIQSLLCSPVT